MERPEIFSPEQMTRLLERAPNQFIPYVAIGGFAGLRSAELERLDWSEVDLASRLIEVKAEKAKSAQRRLVAVSENLAAWLAPHQRQSGLVVGSESVVRRLRTETCAATGIGWRHNALRHSFASYHYGHYKNAALTAADLGHETPTMVFRHYRELVRPDTAAKMVGDSSCLEITATWWPSKQTRGQCLATDALRLAKQNKA